MKYLNIISLMNRDAAGCLLLMLLLLITGCKTQQQTPSFQSTEKKSELSTAEKDRFLQSEYKPERSTKMDKGQVDSIANEKAGLVCKKKGYEKMISNGEQVESQSINSINDMLSKLDALISEKSLNPEWSKFFNKRFDEFMKTCDN